MKTSRTYRRLMNSMPGILLVLILFIEVGICPGSDEPEEKIRPRHRIGFFQEGDSIRYLMSSLYATEGGERTDISNAEVEFYALTDTGEVFIAKATTDAKGMAKGVIPSGFVLPIDSSGYHNCVGVFEGNNQFKGRDAEVSFKTVSIQLEFEELDSLKIITVWATDVATEQPVPELPVKFLVERMFLPLKIAEETTDDEGVVSIEFPLDLPGDQDGNVVIMTRIEDHETYGNYEVAKSKKWGAPLVISKEDHKRALWSPYAPLWMVITFIILMGVVWGHYVVIVVLLRRIKGEGKAEGLSMIWDD